LNGVLHDARVVGIRRHESQPDDEDQEDVQDDVEGDDRPSDAELQPLEFEKDNPNENRKKGEEPKSECHVVNLLV
jgi:hypothetical protein